MKSNTTLVEENHSKEKHCPIPSGTEKDALLIFCKQRKMEVKKSMLAKNAGDYEYGKKSSFIQIFMCIISNTALLSSGMTLGFTAIALPYMSRPNDFFEVNRSQGSWIASLASISTPLGCLISGPIMDNFGRKKSLLLLNIPALIGWLCIAIRPTLIQIYIGRLLTGFACGLSSVPATVYVAESSVASIRGLLVTGTSVAISLGVAIVYTLGLIFQENWQTVAAISGLFPVVSSVLIIFLMPESPFWLMSHGKAEKAAAALKVLRGTSDMEKIQSELDDMTQKTKSARNKTATMSTTIKALLRPESYKPLIIMNTFFLFQQLTGIFVVIFYAVDVVREAGVTTDPFIVAVLIGMTRLVFTILAAFMSSKLGRRPTALISGLGMTVSLLVLATYLFIQPPPMALNVRVSSNESLNVTIQKLNISGGLNDDLMKDKPPAFLPVISILVYILASTIGFLTLPWAMIGEVFPAQVRGVAGGLTTCLTYLVSFVAVKLYPGMLSLLDKHGVFCFYGLMALLGTIFVFFYLPETQGKTLTEIEQLFVKRKSSRNIQETEEEEALSGRNMITIVSSKA